MPRNPDTTSALHPPKINLSTALKELTYEIDGFKASDVTPVFLSSAAVQEALKPGFDNFISNVDCIESDFVGEATNLEIIIEDAKNAANERGAVPLAR